MKSWFETLRHRFEEELAALDSAGVVYEIEEELRAQGILRLKLTLNCNNPQFDLPQKEGSLKLVAIFPDSYPFFRPDVVAESLNLPRHQNPFGKNLCFLPRGTEHWSPETTLVDLLKSQLRKVIIKGSVEDENQIIADEEEQAEPVTEYYATADYPVMFDLSVLNQLNIQEGHVQPIGTLHVGIPSGGSFPSRLAVLSTYDRNNQLMQTAPEPVRNLFPSKTKGALYYLPTPPPSGDARVTVKWLKEQLLAQREAPGFPEKNVPLKNGFIKNVLGLVFKEEKSKALKDWGALFLIEGIIKPLDTEGKVLRKATGKPHYYFARTVTFGLESNKERAPKLKPLSDKRVAVIGLGALGGYSAIELARSGVGELRTLDFDSVDPETIIRWPLGLAFAGVHKGEAVEQFIRSNYPATSVKTIKWRFGSTRIDALGKHPSEPKTEQSILDELFDGISLVLDACAEEGITHLLFREAQKRKIPFVSIYATPGAWGGVVMRMVPEKTEGCWMCMRNHQFDNEQELVPPVDNSGSIQPAGCGDTTFTGAGFDLQHLSLAGVRLIVSTLCADREGGYQDMGWDWAVVKMVDKEYKPIMPQWKEMNLSKHPNCPYCNHDEL